ncbi:hypothetical protein [Vibrio phage JSF7]|uniref:Exonuclease n=1 Tax=Vibrio phage JSF7 TaxID=1292086 RepID=A0A240EWX8_9CAUD|nr:hypothetical protein HOQ92_gp48 [Vibrio phage JSF7]APD18172.1 hypothetical protein [Vibrio phage JSF7]
MLPEATGIRTFHLDADAAVYHVCHPELPLERNFKELLYYISTMRKLVQADYVLTYTTMKLKGGRSELAYYGAYQSKRNAHKMEDPARAQRVRDLRSMLQFYSDAVVYARPNWYFEADEVIGATHMAMLQSTGDYYCSVIGTSDKDLNMYPGIIMDLRKQTFTHLPMDNQFGWVEYGGKSKTKKLVGRGTKFFWAQMLSGDTVDTVEGLPFITPQMLNKYMPLKSKSNGVREQQACGDGKAVELLSRCNSDAACFRVVSELYASYFRGDWPFFFFEMAFILWMRRSDKVLDVMDFLRPLGFDYTLHPQQQAAIAEFQKNCAIAAGEANAIRIPNWQ